MCVPKHTVEIYKQFATKYRYEPESGKFFFISGQSARIGREAGTCTSKGYVYLTMTHKGKRTKLQAHRLAWYMTFGVIPNVIDHINGTPSDNRVCNLESVEPRENTVRGLTSRGYDNIGIQQVGDRFKARFARGGTRHYIGTFDSREDAAAAIELMKISAG